MFSIDNMDNEETAGIAFGRLAGEFIRTKVVPELDAFRFAKYAGTAGISKVATGATLSTGEEVIVAISAAVSKMDEDEVPQDQRYLYITPTLLRLVQALDTTKSREVLDDFAAVKKVPQSRFYTAIKQNDGKTDGENATLEGMTDDITSHDKRITRHGEQIDNLNVTVAEHVARIKVLEEEDRRADR